MTQALQLKPRGLYSHPNPLSEVPAGALLIAQNVIMVREGLIETRRGFKRFGSALTLGSGERPNQMFNYKTRRLVHYATTLAYDSTGAGVWSNYSGSYSPPSGANRIHAVEANKNFYFTTSAGVKKLDSLTATPGRSGMYKALDLSAALNGASGFMNDNSQVAYRVVWGIKDANNNLILGAPSQRAVIANAAGATRNVALAILVPSGVTTSHFFQIYRSAMTAASTETPNDELQLVYEANPTAAEITALSIAVTDITPDSLRGATLYTSPSQQGIVQSNDEPPLCRDLAFFKNMVLYAYTLTKQRFIVTLVSVGGTGLVNDDTIVIGGVTYTGKATETAASGQFKIETGLTAAENIEQTALSLVRVINRYASNTAYYAFYLSGYNDLPGKILIEERGIGGTAYAFTANRAVAWNPQFPTSGTTVQSTNEETKHGVIVSKLQQPEATPLTNKLFIGSADAAIVRIISLRDSCFVFKEDGVFRIVGEDPATLRVSQFDTTVELLAPDSAVALANQIFAFANQGIVAVSENGIAVMSRPIEAALLTLSSALYTNFSSATWAVAYESERTYWLFTVSAAADTYATQAYTFNTFTNEWTGPHPLARSSGVVGDDDDKLYLGSADTASKYIYQERKAYNDTDYSEEEFTITISSSSGTTITVVSSASCAAGQRILQGTREAQIVSVTDATHIEVNKTLAWTGATATVYNPIPISVKSVPQTGGNAGLVKQYSEVSVFFRQADFDTINVGFSSNFSKYQEDIALAPVKSGLWGLFPWGGEAWGGSVPSLQALRTYVPREKQMANWLDLYLTHEQALSVFSWAGWSMQFEEMSERFH